MSQTFLFFWLSMSIFGSAKHVIVQRKSMESKGDFIQPVSLIEEPLNVSCSVPICEGPMAPIYCSGELIAVTWRLGMQETCPGPKMKYEAAIVHKNFKKLSYPIRKEDFTIFCKENFEQISYLQLATLPDFVEDPKFLDRIKDQKIRNFASIVHQRWKSLARSFVLDVHTMRDRFPIVPVPNTFIVPGGLFQVYFYWDSYWIMKGLLVSQLTRTVKGMINNFAFVIDYHGFIPNSGNIQLSRRSQPPLFTQMVADYYFATGDKSYLRRIMSSVEIELEFWRGNRTISVLDKNGNSQSLFQYRAITNCPRPENFLTDFFNGVNSSYSAEKIWGNTASACESGWDFSSRWFDHNGTEAYTKNSIRTNSFIPVDLNSIMAWNFKTMEKLYRELGNEKMAISYQTEYENLVKAIDLLWNNDVGVWLDYDIDYKMSRNNFYPSNVFPLLALNVSSERIAQLVNYINKTGALDYPAGIPSTMPTISHQQWDFPNVWAPTVHLFAMSLRNTGNEWLVEQAYVSANKFVTTVYNGLMNPILNATPGIWEKYDARFTDGRPGSGGEYIVQEGFGWTNGVVLHLIDTFLTKRGLVPFPKMDKEDELFDGQSQNYIVFGVLILLILVAVWFSICGLRSGRKCSFFKQHQNRREGSSSRPLLLEPDDST